jgi:cobalt/nickel transport system permease protein
MFGPFICTFIAAAALLIQALVIAHGCLSSFGANLLAMGVVGSATGFVVFKILRGVDVNLAVSGFFAGLFADWATYAVTSLELGLSLSGANPWPSLFLKILAAFVPTQHPIGIIEGFMTSCVLLLLSNKRSDILAKVGVK